MADGSCAPTPERTFDRRRSPRRVPASGESLSRVRLRTGRELAVVEISNAGALIEGETRLLPGTHVEVHVVTRHGRVLARSRIVRSCVWRLARDSVRYRSALAFEVVVDTVPVGYVVPAPVLNPAPTEGIDYPDGP